MKYANIGQYETIPAKIDLVTSRIIENHDSAIKISFSYVYNGILYKGDGRHYIHYAPYLIGKYYDELETGKEDLLIGILPNSPSQYCKNMDYSVVARYGTVLITQEETEKYLSQNENLFDFHIHEMYPRIPGIIIKGDCIPVDPIIQLFMSCIAFGYRYYLFNCIDMNPVFSKGNEVLYDRSKINLLFGWSQRLIRITTSNELEKDTSLLLLVGPHDLIHQNKTQGSAFEESSFYSRSSAFEKLVEVEKQGAINFNR